MLKLSSQSEPFENEEGLVTPKNKNLYWAFGLVAGSWFICLLVSFVVWFSQKSSVGSPLSGDGITFAQFQTESEFRDRIIASQGLNGYGFVGAKTMMEAMPAELSMAVDSVDNAVGAGSTVDRYSETNVQVAGIDEPDIVKTNGKQLFISSEEMFYYERVMPMVDQAIGIAPSPSMIERNVVTTDVVNALPVETAAKIGSIDANGTLLLTDSELVIFGNQEITGFDITDPRNPQELWKYELEGNRQIQTARLVNGEIILVTNLGVYEGSPCPLPLWKVGEVSTSIACTDVWYPSSDIAIDTTYTISRINPKNGEVLKSTTLVGSLNQSVVYVSDNAVYLTFTKTQSESEILAEVLLDPQTTLISEEMKGRLVKTLALDISQAAKNVEIQQILNSYQNGLTDDDRMKWQTELTNALDAYANENKRELEQTTVSKIPLDSLEIASHGSIPGRPLNQFSLDEYQDHLRIATTVGGRGLGSSESANDVYVLDESMKQVGSVIDLGKDERIYAVRFMGDRGYVVTFRETDPLYSINLANPEQPEVTGELKIPGFSSYLHPLREHILLGVGREDSKVKISLFDVSNPSAPAELDTYLISDYWSDIQNTHHAFLQDKDHEIFFIPTSSGGYIFSYKNDEFSLEKTVADNQINRAVYINDNLYLIGRNEITIIDETNWETVRSLEW